MVADVQGELRDSSKIGGVEVCVLAAEEMGVEIVIHDIRSHGNLGHSSTRLGDGGLPTWLTCSNPTRVRRWYPLF